MKITFTLAEDDILAWSLYYHKNLAPKWQRNLFVILPVIVLTLVLIIFAGSYEKIAQGDTDWYSPIIPLGIFAGIFLYFFSRKTRTIQKSVSKLVKKNPLLTGFREFDFLDDKVLVQTQETTVEYKFSAFLDRISVEDYEFLLIGENLAVIIPKRAFTQSQYEAYQNWAKTYLPAINQQ